MMLLWPTLSFLSGIKLRSSIDEYLAPQMGSVACGVVAAIAVYIYMQSERNMSVSVP